MSNLRGSKAEIYELDDIKAYSLGSQIKRAKPFKLYVKSNKASDRPTEEQEMITVELFKRYFQNHHET